MSLFDRLRPKWKHADPAVRAAALPEISDQSILENLADNDPSEEVRLAAVRALTDQDVLVRFACGPTNLALPALERLSQASALARVALTATETSIRARAVERIEDPVTLHRIAGFDPDAGVRARARGKSAGGDRAAKIIREALARLVIAKTAVVQPPEYSGTLDEVCRALIRDPRFVINGGMMDEDEAAKSIDIAPPAHETREQWIAARFLAQKRSAVADAASSSGMPFYHIKVWRTDQDAFGAIAEERKFAVTHNAVAWGRASSGAAETRLMSGQPKPPAG